MSGWKLTLPCTRAEAEYLAGDPPELALLEEMPTLVTSEEDEAADRWRLDAYFADAPDSMAIAALISAVPSAAGGDYRAEPLPNEDWVTLSQSGMAPVRSGRFYVHTQHDSPSAEPDTISLRIDAGQAFGTGHHDTTAACLAALDRLHRNGRRFTNLADIGTGTGLLAFAALCLWPRATALATDIDPISIRTTADNAAINQIALGNGPGRLALTVADGTADPLVRGRAPYDLIIANILAGPLITLAPALSAIAIPGTVLLLAGMLDRQRTAVVSAYRRNGWRLDHVGGVAAPASGREGPEGPAQWPALVLTFRTRPGWRRPFRSGGKGGLPPGDFGSW
jgi:ribosomal protein L11 methyltransferase